jgi:hypothetical protein
MTEFPIRFTATNTLASHGAKRASLPRQILRHIHALCIAALALSASALAQSPKSGAPHSNLELKSSDTRLVAAFDWAKQQAMAYVFDNDPVGPWYEAALPGRQAFCMRDVSHQAMGAQALGLEKYTHNMLRRFAENISASKDWCSYWEIDRLNRPAPVDYKSDTEFWYNLPANFDVLDTCYRMYLWTGDKTYLDDPVFLNFYNRTVTDYVNRWDLSTDRIMTRKVIVQQPPYFRGDPSYEESRRDIEVGVDLLAAQYAGYRAFASVQEIRGNNAFAQTYFKTAADVKSLINTAWWNASGKYFYAYLDQSHHFHGRAGADLLYYNAIDDGLKTESALEGLLETMKKEPESAVEPKSHYAEILYRYGRPSEAYAQIMDLTRPGRERREYPEVSYSVICAIVTGVMGINVEASALSSSTAIGQKFEPLVSTYPQLTAQTNWVELRHLPVQGNVISVRHDGVTKTTLTNEGKPTLIWKAELPGTFAAFMVNGRAMKTRSESRDPGHVTTWVKVPVNAGQTIAIEASGSR